MKEKQIMNQSKNKVSYEPQRVASRMEGVVRNLGIKPKKKKAKETT